MHPYGQLFLVLRVITAIYGLGLVIEFAARVAVLVLREGSP